MMTMMMMMMMMIAQQVAGMVLANASIAIEDPELRQCQGLWQALVDQGKGGDR